MADPGTFPGMPPAQGPQPAAVSSGALKPVAHPAQRPASEPRAASASIFKEPAASTPNPKPAAGTSKPLWPGVILKQDLEPTLRYFLECLPQPDTPGEIPETINPTVRTALMYFIALPETWELFKFPASCLEALTAHINTVRTRAWEHVSRNKWKFPLTDTSMRGLLTALKEYFDA